MLSDSSTSRVMKGGFVRRDAMPAGENGRALCRWCNLEVPKGRFTFCSEYCVGEWKLRSDPSYLREKTFERDRGVCALCQVDAHAEWNRIRRQRGAGRLKSLRAWGLSKMTRRSLWDADHIVPVAEGGGECDLVNIRTLCLRCHRQVTAEWRAKRPRRES